MHDYTNSSDEEGSTVPAPPLKVDWLDLSCVGYMNAVAISALPGCRFRDVWRELYDDLEALRSLGITDVITLCSLGELRKYRVPSLLQAYEGYGVTPHHFPFLDGGIPTVEDCQLMFKVIIQVIENRGKILVHCYGGMGRAAVICCCLLLHLNPTLSPEEVIHRIQALRGPRAVQSVKQYNFIHEFLDLEEEYLQSRGADSQASRSVSR